MPRELWGSRWLPHYNTKQPIELYRNIHAYMFFNHHVDAGLKTREDEVVEPVENFKYLGSWISDPGHDFKSFNLDSSQQNGKKLWSSKLVQASKIKLFLATVESVFSRIYLRLLFFIKSFYFFGNSDVNKILLIKDIFFLI